MRNFLFVSLMTSCLGIVDASAGSHEQAGVNNQIMSLITKWFGGTYNNGAQMAAQEAQNVPEDKRSMPLHQIVAPIELEGFDGLTYFQQTSSDGTVDTVVSAGVFHFFVDDESGQVMLRLRLFKERSEFINAHLDQNKFKGVALDDLYWNDGCEFYLSIVENGAAVHGEMKEDTCYPVVRSTGKKIKHEDEVFIRPNALWNDGKFYDLEGNFLFGNATGDYQKQIRIDG